MSYTYWHSSRQKCYDTKGSSGSTYSIHTAKSFTEQLTTWNFPRLKFSVLYYGPQEAKQCSSCLCLTKPQCHHSPCRPGSATLASFRFLKTTLSHLWTSVLAVPPSWDTLLQSFLFLPLHSTHSLEAASQSPSPPLILLPEICLYVPFLQRELHKSRDSHSRLYVSYLEECLTE